MVWLGDGWKWKMPSVTLYSGCLDCQLVLVLNYSAAGQRSCGGQTCFVGLKSSGGKCMKSRDGPNRAFWLSLTPWCHLSIASSPRTCASHVTQTSANRVVHKSLMLWRPWRASWEGSFAKHHKLKVHPAIWVKVQSSPIKQQPHFKSVDRNILAHRLLRQTKSFAVRHTDGSHRKTDCICSSF